MTSRRNQGRQSATKRQPDRQERDAHEVQDLPSRDAMSILSGLPTSPTLPPDLLGGSLPAPPTGDPMPAPQPDPNASPGDVSTAGPVNEATITNVNPADTTESTSASQETPIRQV
jgi:hypothetical protein